MSMLRSMVCVQRAPVKGQDRRLNLNWRQDVAFVGRGIGRRRYSRVKKVAELCGVLNLVVLRTKPWPCALYNNGAVVSSPSGPSGALVKALAARLQREGADAFGNSWHAMLARIKEKSDSLVGLTPASKP